MLINMKQNVVLLLLFQINQLSEAGYCQKYVQTVFPSAGKWTEWFKSNCSVTCGNGTRKLIRYCSDPPPLNGGTYCPGEDRREDEVCRLGDCPVDGHWSPWFPITFCTITTPGECSGLGTQFWQRQCNSPAGVGRYCKGDAVTETNCNFVDNRCSDSKSTSNKIVQEENQCGADNHDDKCFGTKTRMRQQQQLVVQGKWSNWEKQDINISISGSLKVLLTRQCNLYDPLHTVTFCDGDFKEEAVKIGDCGNDCETNHWSTWTKSGNCSATCGRGTFMETRKPYVIGPNGQNGSNETRTTKCDTKVECAVDGMWSEWNLVSYCSSSCNTKESRMFVRICNKPHPQNGGNVCPGNHTKIEYCTKDKCPVNGNWGAWLETKNQCGDTTFGDLASRTWSRSCDNPEPTNGGSSCIGNETKTLLCKDAVDGGWSDWSPVPICNITCGKGLVKRTRECNNPLPVGEGKSCEGTDEIQQPCEVPVTCDFMNLHHMVELSPVWSDEYGRHFSHYMYYQVTRSGCYFLSAAGGNGGKAINAPGGRGALKSGYMVLQAGWNFSLIVGHSGTELIKNENARYGGGSGGGASWIYRNEKEHPYDNELLLIAGGGGGKTSDELRLRNLYGRNLPREYSDGQEGTEAYDLGTRQAIFPDGTIKPNFCFGGLAGKNGTGATLEDHCDEKKCAGGGGGWGAHRWARKFGKGGYASYRAFIGGQCDVEDYIYGPFQGTFGGGGAVSGDGVPISFKGISGKAVFPGGGGGYNGGAPSCHWSVDGAGGSSYASPSMVKVGGKTGGNDKLAGWIKIYETGKKDCSDL